MGSKWDWAATPRGTKKAFAGMGRQWLLGEVVCAWLAPPTEMSVRGGVDRSVMPHGVLQTMLLLNEPASH